MPAGLPNQLAALVEDIGATDYERVRELTHYVWLSLGKDPKRVREDSLFFLLAQDKKNHYIDLLQGILTSPDSVTEFLDVAEVLVKAARENGWERAHDFLRENFEGAFMLARFGYRFVGDEIVEAGTDVENRAVDEARELLLHDPRFADAEEKFVSALSRATSARGAEYPEAVHAAVSAVEEVCRELLGGSKVTLDRALDRLRTTHDLNPNTVEMLKKLYHLRSDLEGAAHGAASGSEHAARFAIHTAAAGMIYLIGECA